MKLTHLVAAALVSMTVGMNANAEDRGKAYVSNQDGGVSVIDLNTLKSTGTIDVKAEGPRGLAVSDDGKLLVVATRENGSVSIIDTATGEVLNQIKVGQNPEFVRIRGNFAFVSYEPSAKGGPPPTPGSAEALAAAKEDDDDDKEPARIGIIDLKLGKKIREITGGPETEGIEFSKDGKQLVITNEADNTVTVHNIKTGKLLKTIKTHQYGDRPRGIKVSPDGKTYLATLEYGNKFMVMNKNFKVLRTVDTGATPYGIAYDRKGERIFVAANKAKTLEVYNAKTYEKIKDIPTGNRCWHFTFTPDDKEILLACGKSDAIFVIDSEKLEVTQQIENKKLPWGVVTYPKSMGSLDTAIK
ncbi:MAG: cytochrome D1 domain-containing protein [Methylotenera sp.]|uniref:YVTN family beta-propeller repeat protein n=1 Tax=Methylotenera sp. TaxID=2051956 RepID=UPI0027206B96|nr:cytochrome D1 domain-containing protein [Methylotenera sp.]MDO9205927.1 cytochrome D1 domain-containing protein [Methylotenera sp.]MDO9393640.1 cytochrome D1 domain-containing protein [Methylotenera sp.]MDP2231863.1 cytochrome D1 domain-containing protein [Methylotenera sp.]MDP3140962.1 cytochrome D1 domain-containing protein [Methylotenera sp.]MDP3818857.1 cytochrome D1 domain-containing protein [Methylotenera sp.]